MHAVAKAAGVGQGTLYRHFPTREDLVLAVYESDVERLIASAPRLAATHAPIDALTHWLAALGAYGEVKRGVSQIVLATATRREVSDQWRPRVLGALQSLLDAGIAEGSLRDDITAEDVWPLLGFLWQEPLPPARIERLVAIVLDGLSRQRQEPGIERVGRRLVEVSRRAGTRRAGTRWSNRPPGAPGA